MRVLLAIAATTALGLGGGAAHAQAYIPNPAYASGGYDCGGGKFTLAGARAGVTVLGVDVGASAGLHVGLHDRCRGGGGAPVVYAPPPAPNYPAPYAQPVYATGYVQGGYGPGGYGQGGYGYGEAAYTSGGWGGGYAPGPGYGYPPPCGC